jgi:acetyltransferase-like isoleucine patch superfamily enzyme
VDQAGKQFGWQTRFVAWLDEKISWRTYVFMQWYCRHYFLLRCTEVGKNFRLEWPIRKPIIRGGGKIRIGDNVTILGRVEFMANTGVHKNCEIHVGNGTMIGDNSMISASKSIKIGRECLIARYVYIYDNNGHPLDPVQRRYGQMPIDEIKEVVIGNNVWIGHFAHVQSGVTIGDNSVVAAHSVVTKSVPPNVIVMGSPARVCGWLDKMFPNVVEQGTPSQEQ